MENMNTVAECVALWNKNRKANKGRWVMGLHFEFNGLHYVIKSYDTWIQIIRVGNIKSGNPMEQNVTQASDWLANFVKATVNDVRATV